MHTASISINKTNNLSKINSQQLTGILTFAGGGITAIGSVLPWFSLYAGLQPYSGVIGLNGKILLGAGILTSIIGILYYIKGNKNIRLLINLTGIGLFLFSSWLLIGLWQTYQKLLTQPLIVPKLGPGLFLAAFGALLLLATLFLKKNKSKVELPA